MSTPYTLYIYLIHDALFPLYTRQACIALH
jgi:hypothetical protein